MKTRILFCLAPLLLAACATHPNARLRQAGMIIPTQAIVLAADAAPQAVRGTFEMPVRALGVDHGMTYLNSEKDYRDQRNLSIAIAPKAAQALEARLGAPLSQALVGQNIVVTGEARRVKIVFSSQGRPTDKYYYQTQVYVPLAEQIQLATPQGLASAARVSTP